MYKILLACAAGMSTSMLVEKMKVSAKEQNIDVMIDAVSEGKAKKIYSEFDVLFLGPQVSHMESNFRTLLAPEGIPVEVINMMDYGMMDGKKVLKRAIELIEGEK